MSEADETFLDPDAAASGAAHLTAAGDDLKTRFAAAAARINALNDSKPWGTDQPGRAFDEQYLGKDAPAKVTLDAGTHLVDRVSLLGPQVKSAVDGTVEVDELVKKWFDGLK